MTHFDDLSPYTYLDDDDEETLSVADGYVSYVPDGPRLNVGWLGDSCEPGPVDEVFAAALRAVVDHQRFNVMRGMHACGLCDANPCQEPETWDEAVRSGALGCHEIRVPGAGVVYAAPQMIWHYVTAHGYQPPAAFAAAVLTFVAEGGHLGEPSWLPADALRE